MLDTVMRCSHCLVVARVREHNLWRLNLGFGCCACHIQVFRLLVPLYTWKGGHLFLVKVYWRATAPSLTAVREAQRYVIKVFRVFTGVLRPFLA